MIQITRIRLLGQGGFDLPGAWTSDQCFDLVKRLGGDSRMLYVNLLSYDDEGLLVENDRAAMMPGTPAMLSAHAQWAQRSKDLGEIGATPPPRFVYEPIGVVLPDPREPRFESADSRSLVSAVWTALNAELAAWPVTGSSPERSDPWRPAAPTPFQEAPPHPLWRLLLAAIGAGAAAGAVVVAIQWLLS